LEEDMTQNLKAFVMPDRQWKTARMARVMPKERDPTTKPTFIPLKIHAGSIVKRLTHDGIKEVRMRFPSGVVLIGDPMKMVDEHGKPKSTAILPLFWIEPGQGSLKLDSNREEVGIVVLFRPHLEQQG
jgi:hypothetical protein